MENEQLQQSKPEKQPEKANKVKQILASMNAKEKKAILFIGFFGAILMLVINILKIFFK
jgi:type II secretory pathway component PulM